MEKTINILHLYRKFTPDYTGDGIYYSRLIPLMSNRNTKHIVLATETVSSKPVDVISDIQVNYLMQSSGASRAFDLHRWLIKNANAYDVLHVHSHVSWRFSSYILCRILGKSVIFSCTLDDSPDELIKSYKRRVRKIARILMNSIQVFVAISPRLYLMSLKAVSPERVRNIPQGVLDIYKDAPLNEIRAQIRGRLNVNNDDILLLNVGSICDRKNTSFLIEVLARIKNNKVKLIVVGPELEEDYSQAVNELISSYGLSERVIKVGFSKTPDLYYKACDILVFSSKYEGFSNVYLEAMCNALPVVTLYLPGLVDYLFDHGKTGYFSRDIDAFVQHVEILVNDEGLRKNMGLACRAYVLKHYGLDYVAALYVQLYVQMARDANTNSTATPAVEVPLISDCSTVASGPDTLGIFKIDIPLDISPILSIVVDTEAEFNWDIGTIDDTGRVEAISELPRLIDMLGEHHSLPCLVLDYPVATNQTSQNIVAMLNRQGVELGIHLQPWTTPPFAEPVDARHSFSGNLGPMFERTKLMLHKEAVEAITGSNVRVFKAGRYGASASTYRVLATAGIDIDLSISPGFNFAKESGPDWSRYSSHPGWIGKPGDILSLPTTSGFQGPGWRLAGTPPGSRYVLAAAMSAHLIRPQRMSPEGATFQDLTRMTQALFADGLRVFTLSFHSPSLKPGCTPYTRSKSDVLAFLKVISDYVDFFKSELGGRVMLPTQIRAAIDEGFKPKS